MPAALAPGHHPQEIFYVVVCTAVVGTSQEHVGGTWGRWGMVPGTTYPHLWCETEDPWGVALRTHRALPVVLEMARVRGQCRRPPCGAVRFRVHVGVQCGSRIMASTAHYRHI